MLGGDGRGFASAPLPVVDLREDNTRIDRSCLIRIEAGRVIPDVDGNGVMQVTADGVVIRFAPGGELRGAAPSTLWDQLRGVGIRIEGHRDVVLQGVRIHGFKCAVWATGADGLRIEGGDCSDNYRQRLRSTSQREDAADWLYPHYNDERPWREEYGAAVCVERSSGITIRDLRVRRTQNGIILDRVSDSWIYDNDCSFLSGWGLAMWRSCSNLISRNAFDFCVRGHVEGVYNRGQDSAGILCFEQSSDNVFAENSATHGGDGFFGFAGREAIGQTWWEREQARLRQETGRQEVEDLIRIPAERSREWSARGCNRNLLVHNDFSDASAHGIELTFSEGNLLVSNRVVNNGICGFWGGYSSGTLIAGNVFADNGGLGYGLERGAINMEHASANRILNNLFRNNRCAIHLWWDNDEALLRMPGVVGNERGVTGNLIAGNRIEITAEHHFKRLSQGEPLVGLQLRDVPGGGHVHSNLWINNDVHLSPGLARLFDFTPGCSIVTNPPPGGVDTSWEVPPYALLGRRRPVGARAHLAGRDQIIMDEWGPWDHRSPLIRRLASGADKVRFELRGLVEPPTVELLQGEVSVRCESAGDTQGSSLLEISGGKGVVPWRIRLRSGEFEQILQGTLVQTRWEVVFFEWPETLDPRKDLAGWRRLAGAAGAARGEVSSLDFPYGGGGPRDLPVLSACGPALPGPDHFGMVARTTLRLPAGRWRLRTESDDGVRVRVQGRTVIENWSWHGPTRDEGWWEQAAEGDVLIEVEHFEIDGWAVLRFELLPAEESR